MAWMTSLRSTRALQKGCSPRNPGVASCGRFTKATSQLATPPGSMGPLLPPAPSDTRYGQLGDTCLMELTLSFAISPVDVEEEVDEDVDEDDAEEDEWIIPFARVPVTSTLWPT